MGVALGVAVGCDEGGHVNGVGLWDKVGYMVGLGFEHRHHLLNPCAGSYPKFSVLQVVAPETSVQFVLADEFSVIDMMTVWLRWKRSHTHHIISFAEPSPSASL